MRIGLASLLVVALLGGAAPASASDELLVRFAPSASAAARADALRTADVTVARPLTLPGGRVLRVRPGQSVGAAVAELRREGDVLWAEPNRVLSVQRVPNDSRYWRQWGLPQIGAPAAWDVTTGSSDVVVAVADTGVDFSHPDLDGVVWANPGESGAGRESNGVDDDGNGLVDDVRGWDWIGADPIGEDPNGHGTHVAGTIAAEGDNGTGVTGVTWRARLMSLRVCDAGGSCPTDKLVAALDYAGRMGARVLNASVGGYVGGSAMRDAVLAHPGTLYVFPAGNDGADLDTGADFHPCEVARDAVNAVCVAASGSDDALAPFSNHGDAVGVAAPGVYIQSTLPYWGSSLGSRYRYMDGTSMAAPHVAGAAALVASVRPAATAAQLAAAVRRGVMPAALSGKVDARLDLVRALRVAPLGALDPPAIGGRVQVGGDLRGAPGIWDGDVVSVGYQWQVERDGVFVDEPGATGRYLRADAALSRVRVRLRVTAGDGSAESSAVSAPARVAPPPPATTIVSGPPARQRSTSATVRFASDEPASFECRLDAGAWSPCSSPRVFSGLADGSHTVSVRASSDEGGTDPVGATREFAVDTTPPETTIESGPWLVTNEPWVEFAFAASEPGSSFECRLDNGPWARCAAVQRYDAAALPDGLRLLSVRATDALGNTDETPAVRGFSVRPGAPFGPSIAPTPPPLPGRTGTTLAALPTAVLIDPGRSSEIAGARPGVDLRAGRASGGLLVARAQIAVATTFHASLPAAGRRAARRVLLGRVSLTLAKGQTAPLAVNLSARLKRRLARVKRVRVRMRVSVRSVKTGKTRSFTRTATLRVVGRD